MSVPATAFPPASPPPGARVAFTGQDADFRRLVTRGALLELVTFGFYRFWLSTDIRRHLWSNTVVAGDMFEYTGRGRELLFGFLVAMAVLGPVFLAYFLVGMQAERWQEFASLPLYAFLFAFGQFAAFRARRYRMTRTVWRGIRFWMTGSGWAYALRSVLWGLLLVPSFGLAYPWRMAALERYKVNHTLYGNLPARFEATGGQLFRRVWWLWLLGLLPVMLFVGGAGMVVIAQAIPFHPLAIVGGGAMLVGGVQAISLPFLHAMRKAREWAWWAGGIRFGGVAVACDLASGALVSIYWKLLGLAVLVIAGYPALAAVVTSLVLGLSGRTLFTITPDKLSVWPFVGLGFVYLTIIVTLGILMRIYLVQRVWRRVAAACTVINIGAAADVAAAGDLVSGFGEGLADGLDFGL